MKLLAAAALATTLLVPALARADDADDKRRFAVGLDAALLVPIGSLADDTGVLPGGIAHVGYYVTPKLEAYVVGAHHHGLFHDFTPNASKRLDAIIVTGGARLFFAAPFAGPYASLELGLYDLIPQLRIDGESAYGDANPRLGGNLGAGWVLSPRIPLRLGVELAVMNVAGKDAGESTLIALGALLGYELRF